MKHAIEEFSFVFCFGKAPRCSTNEGDLCYDISFQDDDYDQIYEAIQMLGMFQQENFFIAVSEIFKNEETFTSKKRFMRFLLSRCMKLSEKPTLFSFVIVCTFIDNVMFSIFKDQDCFTIAKMASKCVIAAFNRKYKDVFDKEGGFKEFNTYCEKLNATVLNPSGDSDSDSGYSSDPQEFSPPDMDEVTKLLESLELIEDEDFRLTDDEIKLLYDSDTMPLDLDASEDIFIPLKDSSESKEVKSLGESLQNLNIKSKHVLKCVKKICPFCEDNCYKHVVSVAKELKVSRI